LSFEPDDSSDRKGRERQQGFVKGTGQILKEGRQTGRVGLEDRREFGKVIMRLVATKLAML
jgi:hypothetical protein